MKKKISRIMGVALSLAMLVSLLVMAVPAFALGPVGVVLSSYTISTGAVYTITFDVIKALAVGDEIVVDFPDTTNLGNITPGVDGDVTVGASSGVGVGAFAAKDSASVTTAATGLLTITLPAGAAIGAGATVQLVIGTGANVTNPPGVGDYTLTVKTQIAGAAAVIEAAVASNTYTLIPPVISAVPGVVKGYNAAGVKLYEDTGANAISKALPATTAGVVRVVVGPGTYDETNANPTGNGIITIPAGVTVESSDGAAVTIIKDVGPLGTPDGVGGVVSIASGATGAVLDGFTVAGGVTATATGAVGITIKNCVLSGAVGLQIDAGGATAGVGVTSSGNTYNVAAGLTGINVKAGITAAVSSGDTINVAATGFGIVNNGGLTVTGGSITGASGTGITNNHANAVSTITAEALTGLETAINVVNGALSITGSTITGCGDATAAAENPAINVTAVAAGLVKIANNTIADCVHQIMNIAANQDKVFMNFNTINNPAAGIVSAAATADCANNLWDGGAAPAVASPNAEVTPYLTGAVSNAEIAPAAATLGGAANAASVLVADSLGGAWVNAGIGNYAENPGTAAVPGNVIRYFDVYVNTAANNINLTFYGITSAAAKLYAWSAAQGIWVQVGAGVDLFQGALTFTVTANTVPTLGNLEGLPFAMCEPALAPLGGIGGVTLVPAIAAMGVGINPTFTWGAVAGADNYDFVLSEEIGQDDPFAIPEYADTCRINAHVAKKTLKYNTQYHWRVRPSRVIGIEELAPGDVRDIVEKGAWTEGLFITMTEPEEEEPPIIIEPQEPTPAPIINIEPIVIPPAEADPVQVIPDYLLWIIIAVGAILVIAVIVLIVRTRRVT